MPENEVKKYEFLDRQGVIDLAEQILKGVNTRIAERIVQTVDKDSDANHVPSAAAVYAAIAGVKATKLVTHTGNIEDVTDPETNAIYLQRDDESDVTWTMYVYASVEKTTTSEVEGEDPTVEFVDQWISIGTTELALDNYWSKTDEDLVALKEALGIENISAEVENKVSADQLVAFTTDDITSLVATAFENTDVLNPKEEVVPDETGEEDPVE